MSKGWMPPKRPPPEPPASRVVREESMFEGHVPPRPLPRPIWATKDAPMLDDTKGLLVAACEHLMQAIGEKLNREGLLETPERFADAWREWSEGYRTDVNSVLKSFADGANGYDEMITISSIPVYSHCEHHLAPFFGTATIGYIPDGRIAGLSKFGRLVNVFSRRLQVQERLTAQIADAIHVALNPKGVGVMLRCRHLCMESRGIRAPATLTTTTALRGALQAGEARGEFLAAAAARLREE